MATDLVVAFGAPLLFYSKQKYPILNPSLVPVFSTTEAAPPIETSISSLTEFPGLNRYPEDYGRQFFESSLYKTLILNFPTSTTVQLASSNVGETVVGFDTPVEVSFYFASTATSNVAPSILGEETGRADTSVKESLNDARETIAWICDLDRAGSVKLAARIAMRYVERYFRRGDLSALNLWLKQIDPHTVSEWVVVAVLRTTSRAKRDLPAWGALLSTARTAFDERELDTNRLLIGML